MKTKSLPKTLLALVALMTCLGLAPKTTWAQQHSVPYGATVIAGYIPQDWVTSNNYGPIPYNGLDYYAFSTGIIVLPELDAPTNTLTVDVNIQPFVNPVYGSIFQIGYVTDVNDLNTFHEIQNSWYMYELPWEGDIRCKRAVFSGVPENARIAFVTIYEWFIQSVLVYETPDPFDVPYSLPSFQSGVGQNEGWMINNYVSYYQYFREGTALLPEFNSSLNLLEMDVLIKPYDYSAQNIQVGYVTNPNSPSSNWNFVSVQSFNASSSWTGFMPKRISYSSAPSGARMAISCNGRWEFNNIYVYNPASTVYSLPYQYSFGQTLPGGWLSNNYGYNDGTAFLTDGIAVLPDFQYDTWRELELDLAAMPRNSQARNIKIGYITDPNDPSTFVDVQTFSSNTSSWTEIQPKRVDYAGIAAGARLAIQCNGDWNIRDVAVRYKPSTIYPTQSNPYHLATFDTNQPEGWIANSYVNEGRFKTGVNQLPRLNSAVSINSLFLDVDIKPSSSNTSFSLGYVTTSQAVTTFTALKTFNSSTDWTDFRIQRLDFNDVPSGARMAISFAGEWTIRDVKLYPTPSPTAVPYNPTLGEGQPDGWMANNYGYSSGNAYLNNGLAILPQFNAEISTLLLDIALKPKNSSAHNIKLGYVTDPNNPSTFVATHTYVNSSWEYYLLKRARFVSAPAGARLAILCDGDWNIAGVSVKSTNDVQTVFDVPYNLTLNYNYPEGWTANNLNYSSTQACFTTGYAVLPQFNAPINTLQFDIKLKPSNTAQTFQIGYVTNPNSPSATFTALQSFSNASYWNEFYQRRACFDTNGIPTNARLAIHCEGTWWVSAVTVSYKPEPISTPYVEPILALDQPAGWIANNMFNSSYMNRTCADGYAVLPQFSVPIEMLQLEFSLRTWDNCESFSVGYITNPNDFSTFTALETYSASSIGTTYSTKTISYAGVPSNARMAFYCAGMWVVSNAVVTGEIPQPSSVTVSNVVYTTAKVSWTRQSTTHTQWDVCVCEASITTPPAALIHHVQGYLYYNVNGLEGGHTYKAWVRFNNGSAAGEWVASEPFSTGVLMTPPYTQEFANSSIPEGWRSFYGSLEGPSSPYTATLTPESGRWHFGAANGVFNGSSHAYVNIGGYQHHFWLVSPFLHLDANANMLSVDLAITRPTGNMVPMTPDAQDNTIIKVLISADYGATWIPLRSWKHEMGYTDLESLTPEGYTCTCNLSAYANQDILIGFYMECTDPDDASNRIHIDNFNVTSFDPTLPPTAVTVSEIAGHSAKVSWTPALSVQYKWDVIVAHVAFNPNTDNMEQLGYYDGVMEHVEGYRYKTITGLIPNYDSYKAWVRYNDGTITSLWLASEAFETDVVCPRPRDITIVEQGYYGAIISWTPGDESQTRWNYYIEGWSDMDSDTEDPYIIIPDDEYIGLTPGGTYILQLKGDCGDDGLSETVVYEFTKRALPHLTVNEGNGETDETVPITGFTTGSQMSRTQFIIPAEQLADMQYSTIRSLTFYNQQYTNGTPWGTAARFDIYLKEVGQNDFSNGAFYNWNDMTPVVNGAYLSISGHEMTVSLGDGGFSYTGGNLLVGFCQQQYDYTQGTNFDHADWLGVNNYNTNPNYKPSIYYNPSSSGPFAQTFSPKVTFTYDDTYLPPTNIVVTPIAPTEVTLTWTMRDGQTATDVQLLDEDMEPIGTPWTWSNGNVFGLGNLDPGTDYYVSLRGQFTVGDQTYYSAWTNPVAFSTPDYCAAPDNLQVNEVGPFSATLTWDSSAAYEEVEYRAVQETGFENGVPEGWTAVKKDASSGGWFRASLSHNGSYGLASICTNRGDDWLISPQVELGGALRLWKTCAGNPTDFMVYVSTTGMDIDGGDFGEPVATITANSSWGFCSVNLSAYSGLGYIAIRHNDLRGPSRSLYIDDLQYYAPWTSLGYVEGGQYDFEGLTPGTTYQAQVRSMCEVGDASYLGYWTAPVSFSTPGNIVFQDPVAKSASVYLGDTNGDGELSYAEAAAITDLTLIFKDQVEMQYFNELQYFTGLTAIGDNAFSGCVNLSAITLPPTITSIGFYAFGYSVDNQGYPVPCSSLHNIVIPPSVTTIGAYAFSQSGLTEVILPPSVTSIGTLAFGDCDNLEYVYLPASVTSIEGNAFTGASIWTIEVDQENPVYDSRGGCNAIIQTDINKLITGCKNTVIPDDVVSIGVSAFENATGLTTINLPSSVESIGEYAFANCSGLTTIYAERPLPPTIYGNTFLNMVHSNVTVNVLCGALSDYKNAEIWSGLSFNYVDPCNIVFADANVKAVCVTNWDTNGDGELSYTEAAAVTNIGTVFRDNTSIISFNELQYFTGLVGLANYAFQGCSQLTSIILPNSIIITTHGTFSGCSSLTSVTLSSSLQRIANSMFQDCSALTHIDIPATVTTIGQDAFTGCSSLTSIVIPASTTTIYNSAFNNCHSLQSIVVEPENTVYDSRNACNAIIKTETDELVIGCDNTEIPDDVVTIGANAFYGRSQMTTIVLPASVTSIGSTAFMGCGGVMEMHVNATTPPSLGNGVFGGFPAAVYPGIPVYVPCESIAAYQAAAGWSSFTNYQESDVFICFADPAVKAICVAHWDTNGDGQLSYAEAAAVRTLNPSGASNSSVFKGNTTITSFDELQYFTGLSVISLYAFQNCTALTSVTLPPTVTKIEYEAFMNCGLTGTLTLPDAVTTIEQDAFSECRSLTGLVIGSGVTSIGTYAFYSCTGLESITIEAVNPPALGTYNPFDRVPEGIPVYVPCVSVADYQTYNNGAPWGGFNSIQGMGCENSRYLSAGWTWWVPYLDVTADELRNAFDEGTITGDILINSQSEGFLRRTNGEWGGTLSDFVVGKMYKIKTVSDGSFNYNGARPTTVAVTIEPGYNWFGIQGNSTAIATLITPANGDKILKDDGTWVTFDGTYWIFDNGAYSGSFVIQPGIGYIYYNATNETKTMTFSY